MSDNSTFCSLYNYLTNLNIAVCNYEFHYAEVFDHPKCDYEHLVQVCSFTNLLHSLSADNFETTCLMVDQSL